MRQLTVVSVSDDGTHLLLATRPEAKKPAYLLAIDARLAAAVRGDLDNGARRESVLSPKEIQARLRAGETPEQVAKVAEVPVSRVLRYFGPVASERERIVTQAQAATVRRPRGPASTVSLGVAVERRLAVTNGLRRDSVEWSAKRRDDGAWVVSLSYAARGRVRTATWLWRPAVRELTAADVAGARITAEDRGSTPRVPAIAAPVKTVAPIKKAPAKKAPAKRLAAKKTAVTKAPVKKTAVTKAPVKKAAVKKVPAAKKGARASAPRAGRVPVPSWDDVLFGAAPPTTTRRRRRS